MTERKTYNDIKLICKTCNKEFVYSVTEQRFFEEKGFGAPVRCHECRKAKKERNAEHEEKKQQTTPAKHVDANEDWVTAYLQRWNEQLVLFGDKD